MMELDAGAKRVLERLAGAGYRAYAVGGCVRDSLLGRRPQDWDICTSALPEQTIALFGREHTVPTGLQHGTVSVKEGGALYEVTTFRTDGSYSDGRHPDSVSFIDEVTGDLARRDFTINAMAYNDAEGLIDPFGGREDLLAHRVVRAVGEPMRRFEEERCGLCACSALLRGKGCASTSGRSARRWRFAQTFRACRPSASWRR